MTAAFYVGVATGIVVAYTLFRYWGSPLRHLFVGAGRL